MAATEGFPRAREAAGGPDRGRGLFAWTRHQRECRSTAWSPWDWCGREPCARFPASAPDPAPARSHPACAAARLSARHSSVPPSSVTVPPSSATPPSWLSSVRPACSSCVRLRVAPPCARSSCGPSPSLCRRRVLPSFWPYAVLFPRGGPGRPPALTPSQGAKSIRGQAPSVRFNNVPAPLDTCGQAPPGGSVLR